MSPIPVGSQKRQDLIDVAHRLFLRDGYHATGIDRIIAESNVAKMTMYRHFPSKTDLIVAVLKDRATRFEDEIDELLATGTGPERKIRLLFDWYRDWFLSAGFSGCPFANALSEFKISEHPVHFVAAVHKNELKQRIQNILTERLSPARAEAAALTIAMLLEGATVMARIGAGPDALANAQEVALGLCQSGTANSADRQS